MITINNCHPILANSPHPSVSNKYRFIDSKTVLSALEKQGFYIERLRASRSQYGLHTVTLRHPELKALQIGDSELRPEVIFKNSHDRSARLGLIAGVFRSACFNGLILGYGFGINLTHIGNIEADIKDVTPKVFELVASGVKRIEAWSRWELTHAQQVSLAKQAIPLRIEPDNLDKSTIELVTEQMLKPKRQADEANDLFTVYNRLQEYSVKGGIIYPNELGKETKTRRLTGASATLKVNQDLSNITETFYQSLTKAG